MLPPPPPPPRRQGTKQEVKEENVPPGDTSRANQRGGETEQRVKQESEVKPEQTGEQEARAKAMPTSTSSSSAREENQRESRTTRTLLRRMQDPSDGIFDPDLPDFDDEEPHSPLRDEQQSPREVFIDGQSAGSNEGLTRDTSHANQQDNQGKSTR